MAKVVNLRQARKNAARGKARAAGDENAARHGQTKAGRALAAAQAEKLARALDAHRLEGPGERRDD